MYYAAGNKSGALKRLMDTIPTQKTRLALKSFASRHEEDACTTQWVNNVIDSNVLPHSGYSFTNKEVDDIYEKLWVENMDLAKETLHVDFLNQMQIGSLDANRFVKFTLQDNFYIQEVTKMLKEVSEKDGQPDNLRDFMKGRYDSYKAFLDSFDCQFSIKDASFITPTPATGKYLSTYRDVKCDSDSIYFAVALLPCSRLWVWLADHLNIAERNTYYKWKIDNMGGHPEKFKPILNKYLDTVEKVQKANTIFRKQMQNEHDFFSSS